VAAAGGAPAGLPGAGAPRLLPVAAGVHLVVADVPLPEYSAAGIESRLEDLGWVSDRALAHESVVEHFAAHGDVLPLKLFTLFADDNRAVAELAADPGRVERLLDRVGGAEEWGVRVRFSRERARQGAAGDDAPASGRDFLERKRRQRDAARGGAEEARAAAAAAHRRLAAAAREAVERPVPPGTRRRLPGDARRGRTVPARARRGRPRARGELRGHPHRSLAAVPLRRRGALRGGRRVSEERPAPRTPLEIVEGGEESVVDLVDHLLDQGVVVSGDLVLGLADVDLVYLRLSVLLCAADRVLPR
jgi:hypothetical protein